MAEKSLTCALNQRAVLWFLMLSALTAPANAQTLNASPAAVPSVAQMIEQLKSPRVTRGLTGDAAGQGPLRNLSVEAQVPPPGAVPVPLPSTPSTASSPEVAAPVAMQVRPPAPPSLSLQIQFEFDSVRVRPESQKALGNLAQALQSPELLPTRFAIEGHTDATGRSDYNQRLSQQRAEAVRDYLAIFGVDAHRLQPRGKGASDPSNRGDPFAAENRRVRIVNLTPMPRLEP